MAAKGGRGIQEGTAYGVGEQSGKVRRFGQRPLGGPGKSSFC